MSDRCVTELDKIGMRLAAKEELEKRLGLRPSRRAGRISSAMEPLEDLISRDEDRVKDGFPKKIKWRRVLVGSNKVLTVPFVEEERLLHGDSEPKHIVSSAQFNDGNDEPDDLKEVPGSGSGEVGEVIGEIPIPRGGDVDGDGGDQQPGDEDADHIEEDAYTFGKQLSQKLNLPNLSEKRKRFPTDEYTFELTDRHRGSGQVLDKKETLKRIARTNLILGRVDPDNMDPAEMLVADIDKVYRVLSRERIYKSRAIVFLGRDYSGSMYGDPTRALVSQHLMIYSWLLFQYEKMVIPRFVLHDTEAREVTPRQYFGLSSGGGTVIASLYKKINEIVESEGLAEDYDIFVFQGTDGDDFERSGSAVAELQKILSYARRIGVTLFKNPYMKASGQKTTFETYIEAAGIHMRRDVFRMHSMPGFNVSDDMNLEALKVLIAQD
ncbi:MAG: DUF444 family protein [bacterium]|nr:DUF444 family protein [bacterium]